MKPKESHRLKRQCCHQHQSFDTLDVDDNSLFLVCIDSDKVSPEEQKQRKLTDIVRIITKRVSPQTMSISRDAPRRETHKTERIEGCIPRVKTDDRSSISERSDGKGSADIEAALHMW